MGFSKTLAALLYFVISRSWCDDSATKVNIIGDLQVVDDLPTDSNTSPQVLQCLFHHSLQEQVEQV
jgi:hypothetical protein